MGFGRGIDEAARQGVEVMDPRATGHWRHATVSILPSSTQRIFLSAPKNTPPLVSLAGLTTPDARAAHAWRLVTEFAVLPGGAERTEVGDACDLFVHVVRRRFGDLSPQFAGAWTSRTMLEPDDVVVHVGTTRFVRDLLQAVCAGRPAWNGDPAELDGDGYVLLTVRAADADPAGRGGHVVIVGGSDYGAAFGVSALLEESFGAAWVLPGEVGEVIPRVVDATHPSAIVYLTCNVLEEPMVRSRSFGAMTANLLLPEEIDASRSWQIRNRMRPGTERVQLHEKRSLRPGGGYHPLCGPPTEVTASFHFAMLEPEERVPSHHVVCRLLSPFEPPVGVGAGLEGSEAALPRFRSRTTIYPDVRAREPVADATESFDARGVGMVHPILGQLSSTFAPTVTTDPCVPMCCPTYVPFRQSDGAVSSDGSSSHLVGYDGFCGALRQEEQELVTWRFIPRALRNSTNGRLYPDLRWHPCVFENKAGLAFGAALSARVELARDLANQVLVSFEGRRLRGRDLAHSMAFEDGAWWCRCDACTRSDNASQRDGRLLFYRGRLISTAREAQLECTRLPAASGSAPVNANPRWNASAQNPFASLTLDELAWRGVVFHIGSPSTHTLRLLSLANAACRWLERAGPWRRGDEPVLSIFAYVSYMAPPLQGPARVPQDLGERCHPYLLPFMTGVRDTVEYDPSRVGAAPPSTGAPWQGALARSVQQPDRFNQERWSAAGARRIGLYEYIHSRAFLVPRPYSRRLRTALVAGERARVRAFVAEVLPVWGLDGPMYWEWSRLLWSHQGSGARVREAYCEKAFGAAAAPMKAYLDECEAAWASTRDEHTMYSNVAPLEVQRPDFRSNSESAAAYLGQGYGGRGGYLSQLDGWYRPSASGGPSRLLRAWALLNDARNIGGLDAGARERVRLVRQSFGFTLLIALWYRPFYDAFERIRRAGAGHGRLQDIVKLLGGDFVRPAMGAVVQPDVFLGHFVRSATGGTVAGVVPRDDFARAGTMTTTAVPPVDMGTEAMLRTALRQRLGTRDASGIRALRNDVHRYLALSGLSSFRSLGTSGLPAGLDDLGFGLFSSSGWMPPSATMPMSFVPLPSTDPTGPHRMVGLYLPDVLEYIGWWNGIAARRPEDRVVLVREDAQGIGWIFNEIKRMAAVVLLYASGVAESDFELGSMKLAVLEG